MTDGMVIVEKILTDLLTISLIPVLIIMLVIMTLYCRKL